jgi:hypothetical protein
MDNLPFLFRNDSIEGIQAKNLLEEHGIIYGELVSDDFSCEPIVRVPTQRYDFKGLNQILVFIRVAGHQYQFANAV